MVTQKINHPVASYRVLKTKKRQLFEVLFWHSLFLDVPFDRFPIGSFSDSGNIIAICPELTAPEVLFDGGFSCEYLPSGDALKNLDDPTGGELGMRSAEKVDMILVHAHRFDLNFISLFYARSRLSDYAHNLFVEKGFPVLDREDDVVMNLPGTVVSFSNPAFIVHLCSITKTPCSKLQGTLKREGRCSIRLFSNRCSTFTVLAMS